MHRFSRYLIFLKNKVIIKQNFNRKIERLLFNLQRDEILSFYDAYEILFPIAMTLLFSIQLYDA